MAWTGPAQSVVKYEPELDPQSVREAGAIKFSLSINGTNCTVWLGAGPGVIERLDGLWRRQVKAAIRSQPGQLQLFTVELAQLAVPPSMLGDYTRTGAVIDLEMVVGDQVIVRADGKPLFPAKLCSVHDNFAVEAVPGTVAAPGVPDGSTRLSIEFLSANIDSSTIPEISQIGAIYDTGIPLSNEVSLIVNREQVARAVLCTYEGRFALSVK